MVVVILMTNGYLVFCSAASHGDAFCWSFVAFVLKFSPCSLSVRLDKESRPFTLASAQSHEDVQRGRNATRLRKALPNKKNLQKQTHSWLARQAHIFQIRVTETNKVLELCYTWFASSGRLAQKKEQLTLLLLLGPVFTFGSRPSLAFRSRNSICVCLSLLFFII